MSLDPIHSLDPRALETLTTVMARLRDPQYGCPWDVKQDFRSIARYTIEEAHEVAEAIERGDLDDLKDELGDLLLQVAFHARMAEEQGAFAFADVVAAINDKMIRRHPHVFAGATVADAEAQTQAWEAMKAAERARKPGARTNSALDAVTGGLPEFQRAVKLQKAAATVGFTWPNPRPVLAKLREEVDEVAAEMERAHLDREALEDEIGDVLFVAANLARHHGIDPAAALRR